ncbi:MAG: hypothetical protein J07HQW2_03868 [Haloquadratum walsbyi J07HQW2]|uniref:Uncharacterized protein n=1 Tax=Haloquadratum walsbyi J07HQW2 TaxID=1238425 RepID=U1PUC3_9EURY|nr:MAG: hypothetical protein J07HQW2_03868 [Haloquadratum walsbyi J07HQW2]
MVIHRPCGSAETVGRHSQRTPISVQAAVLRMSPATNSNYRSADLSSAKPTVTRYSRKSSKRSTSLGVSVARCRAHSMAHRKAGSVPPLPCRYHQRAALRTTMGFVGGCSPASPRVIDSISSGTSAGLTSSDCVFAISTGMSSIETLSGLCY